MSGSSQPNPSPSTVSNSSNGGESRWCATALDLLSSTNGADREAILEFLSYQSRPEEADAIRLFPRIGDNLLHPDPQVRYHARKARDRLVSTFPILARDADLLPGATERSDQSPLPTDGAGGIPTREILLRKLRLGSRYLAFEAIERLTDSRDPELAESLIEFLANDRDPFKTSFLLKRLSRISHPRIPSVIEGYLDHPDPRIVANALEGLADCDVPNLKATFARLAESGDNRIRANAVRALFRYDPLAASLHIEEMLRSSSVALQDSGVYLLGTLRPERIDELLELALASKFTTVRMRALEIPRLLAGTTADRRRGRDSRCSTRQDPARFRWLGGFLGIGLVQLLLFPVPAPLYPFGISLIGILLLFLSWNQPRQTMYPPIGASLLCLAALSIGTAGALPLLGFLLIWLGLPSAELLPNARRMRVFAWMWAGLALTFSWYFGGENANLMAALSTFPVPATADSVIVELIGQQQRFSFTYFSFAAVGAFVLAWLGRKEYPEGQASPTDQQVLAGLGAGVLIMVVLQVAFSFGIQAMLATRAVPGILHLPPMLSRPATPINPPVPSTQPVIPAIASSTTPH